jgi:hypothetical protein
MPENPRFVLGDGDEVQTISYDSYPENAPSTAIVVDARFALAMVVAPTCHVSEGEKDEAIVAIVPVDPLNLIIPDLSQARAVANRKNVPLHLFPLPATEVGNDVLRYSAVALLDRPASVAKTDLRRYRRLGLYLDARIQLRKALARFWARGRADDDIDRAMASQRESRSLEDLE